MLDHVLDGQAYGSVAEKLLAHNFDPLCLRPYIGGDGRSYITVNTGKFDENGKPVYAAMPVHNVTATLRKDEWIQLDTAVMKAGRERLGLVADVRGAGLVYSVPNGMGRTVLQTQAMSDPGTAHTSMDGIHEGERDRPHFDITNLPLPITHSDFSFTAREIATSRNSGSPIDVTMAEAAGRRVAEELERTALGTNTSFVYGGGTVYGLTNYPSRLTKVITNPTAGGWTPATLVEEVLAMKQQSIAATRYGPWKIYNAPNWDQYLDNDYSAAKGTDTLRDRILRIQGITGMMTLDYLTGYQLVMVQMTSDVVRMVVGMDLTTLQWETHGGLKINFKVMAIVVPQLRVDFNSKSGVVHGNVA